MTFPRTPLFVAGTLLLTPVFSVSAQDKAPTPKPAKSTVKKPRIVALEMAEGLRFSPPRFEAKPGELLAIELENADPSHQPHNFLLVQQ